MTSGYATQLAPGETIFIQEAHVSIQPFTPIQIRGPSRLASRRSLAVDPSEEIVASTRATRKTTVRPSTKSAIDESRAVSRKTVSTSDEDATDVVDEDYVKQASRKITSKTIPVEDDGKSRSATMQNSSTSLDEPSVESVGK
jgi:hypothetical protein